MRADINIVPSHVVHRNPEDGMRALERKINKLIEESAFAAEAGDMQKVRPEQSDDMRLLLTCTALLPLILAYTWSRRWRRHRRQV